MGGKESKAQKNNDTQKISQIYTEEVEKPEKYPPQVKPLEKVSNPFPEIPNYMDMLTQVLPVNKYPKVPNYLTHELITDLKMLKHLLTTASTCLQKSSKINIDQPLYSSRLIEVNDHQNKLKSFQSSLLNEIQTGQLSQIIEKDQEELTKIKLSQVIESLKLIAKYAFYCQGLLQKIPETSKEFLVSLNNLILSTNMNSILLQYIGYYDEGNQAIRQNAQTLFKQFLESQEFSQVILKYLDIVKEQLNNVVPILQNLNDCSNIFQFEEENDETFIQIYQKIQSEPKKQEFHIKQLFEQKQFQSKGLEKAEQILEDQKYENFVQTKLDDSEGSKQFTLLLRQFIDILEEKTENWENVLRVTLMATTEKDKIRLLLCEFSKLQIQSSLHLVHFCINELQYKMDYGHSFAQLQKFVQIIDKI
ncbi:unnamed protein product (macronuclear) [Paramecium tetraurelia]|uniref:Uncharacterized protein n=1 Tax=Paramecium tetraurelia TaxID=5888 RepID=A0BRF5_PARTE|nr:uncharacterized protein GSPATT00031353001 [Paramecium tetraurelia]CAK61122.1 unnamed protein product [Paramecium tetraurelia]|eukprot:XP_001428520.1 hypothetical protein (macronuclear) [Paramecium tetraurelia strain d4-2]